MLANKNDIVIFLVVTTVIIMALALLVIYFLFSHSKKQLLHVQTINKLNLDHEKSLMTAKLDVQELTLNYVSKEIHDNINHSLVLSKFQLDHVDFKDEADTKEKVTSSADLISQSIHDLNHITKALDNDMIKGLGLVNALRNEINRLKVSGLFTIEAHISGQIQKLEPEKELYIFRIAQEAFNNILKHSHAKVIDISLNYYEDHIDLIITDNGKGFDYILIEGPAKGAGLNNIKIRTQVLNGKVSITSAPDMGTSVRVSIPY